MYGEIGKETSNYPDPAAALESAPVQAILGAIRELNLDIETMKQRIVDLEKIKADTSQPAPKKAPQASKNASPESGGVAAFFIHSLSSSLAGILPGEKSSLERKIAVIEKKMQELYVEIAKETANFPDPATAITSAPVVGLLTKVHGLKAEIAELKQRIVDIAEGKKAEKAQRPVKTTKPEATAGSVENDVQEGDQSAGEITVDATREESIGAIPEEHAGAAIVSAATEAAPASQGTDAGAIITADENTPVAVAVDPETRVSSEEPVNELLEAVVPAAVPADAAPVSGDGREQTDAASIGYDRTRPCLISTPTPQPPTRKDIETAIRRLQEGDTREERIRAILEEHAGAAVVTTATVEAPAPEEADRDTSIAAAETAAVEVAAEPEASGASEDVTGNNAEETPLPEEQEAAQTVAEEEPPLAEVTAEPETSGASEDVAGNNTEEAPLPVEQEAAQTVAEEEPPIAEITAEPETSGASEEAAGNDAEETPLPVEPEAAQTVAEEEPPLAEVTAEPETSGASEEAAGTDAEETPLPEEPEAVQTAPEEALSGEGLTPEQEKKKIALQFEDETDKNRWKSIMTSPDEFSIIRTKSHTAAFASLPDGKTDNPGHESKPEMNTGHESGPEFRSRVHQPTYAATPAGIVDISAQEEAVARVEGVMAGRVKSAERESAESEQYAQLKKEAQKKSQHRPVFTTSEVIANNARKSNPKKRS